MPSGFLLLLGGAAGLFTTPTELSAHASTCASNWPGTKDTCQNAVAVCLAESSGNCKAKYVNKGGSVDRGLWQVNDYWHSEVADSCAYDCACNGKAALKISSSGSDWTPWATFNSGAYKSHLSEAQAACNAKHAEMDLTQEEDEESMSEDEFLSKWGDYVMRIDSNGGHDSTQKVGSSVSRRQLQADPFSLLIGAIGKITGAWQSITSAFGSKYSQQLLDTHMDNGWKKFKSATKVFKGAGLDKEKMDSFFKDVRKMAKIPKNYTSDFNAQIDFIQMFDNLTWSEHNTQFNTGKDGMDTMFTMFARNRDSDGKLDVLFLTCAEQFKLADNYFVISQEKSILGGLFDHSKIVFKKKKASITNADLMFLSEYFSLIAYQQIALAEGVSAPPDPKFPSA
jgi:hypothetical protein